MAHLKRRTVALIRLLRAAGPIKRRRRIPRQQQPDLIRKAYFDALLPFVHRMQREFHVVRDEIVRMLRDERQEQGRTDESRADRARRFVLGSSLRFDRVWEDQEQDLRNIAERFGHRTSAFQSDQLERQVDAGLGIPLAAIEAPVLDKLAGFVSENVRLVKSVGDRYYERLEGDVREAFDTGMHPDTLAELFVERDGMAEHDARRIARDQIGKLSAQFNEARQKEIGVTTYIWRTANDNRVRDEHGEREGEQYTWDDPPEDGNPGEPIMCRCYAEPVFDELTEAAEPEAAAPEPAEPEAAEE